MENLELYTKVAERYDQGQIVGALYFKPQKKESKICFPKCIPKILPR